MDEEDFSTNIVQNELCPLCQKNTLVLTEIERDIPFFGLVYIFSMNCTNDECGYSASDVETAEEHEPMEYSLDIQSEADLTARVVKSSEATIKLGRIASVEPGPASKGFVSNVEGVLKRIERGMEMLSSMEDDPDAKSKLRSQMKKLRRIMTGFESGRLTISDPSGNSAIIHDRVVKKSLKRKKG